MKSLAFKLIDHSTAVCSGTYWRAVFSVLVLVLAAGCGGGGTDQAMLSAGNPIAILSWDANSEPDTSGYKIYYGTASRSYGEPIDVANETTYTVAGLESGTYYFAVTAYNSAGYESDLSSEVSKTFSDPASGVVSGSALSSPTLEN